MNEIDIETNEYHVVYSTGIRVEETTVHADRFDALGEVTTFWVDCHGTNPETKPERVAVFYDTRIVKKLTDAATDLMNHPTEVSLVVFDSVYVAQIKDPTDSVGTPPKTLELQKGGAECLDWQFLGMAGDIPIMCVTEQTANRFNVNRENPR
jgi:hypothetical protein